MHIRMQLAEAKIALRDAEQEAETIKAIAETEIIAAVDGKYGANEADRKRFLTVALDGHAGYCRAQDRLSAAKAAVEGASAAVAIFEDERRQARLVADERHTVALERLAAAWEGLGQPIVAATGRAVALEDWA